VRVCSHQPSFLPWIGFWNKLAQVDRFIATVGVQFTRRDFQHRVMVQGAWMVLPIASKSDESRLLETEVASTEGMRKAAETIQRNLCVKKNLCHSRLEPVVEYLATSQERKLYRINLDLQLIISKILDLEYDLVEDTHPPDLAKSTISNLIARVNRHVTRPEYYAGPGIRNYFYSGVSSFPIKVQVLRPEVSKESILQLIARTPDPRKAVMEAAQWEALA
jgi:hypothetical protein